MIACLDVDYRATGAVAACVGFLDWTDAVPAFEVALPIDRVEPYEPGQFYRRELPCLLALLECVAQPLDVLVVDGYVWLGDETRPGLGAHLHQALGGSTPVVGVAKTRYEGATAVEEVLRGRSRQPLYVGAVGMDRVEAADRVRSMHGPDRIPTLLKRVDRLARDSEPGFGGVPQPPVPPARP